jgi:hypothetical protein
VISVTEAYRIRLFGKNVKKLFLLLRACENKPEIAANDKNIVSRPLILVA